MKNLLIDIETSPHKVYTFGLWNQNISMDKLIQPTEMMSFAAKWRGEKKVEYYSLFHHSREEMVGQIWELLNEADAVTTYNGKKFDEPHWNREIALLGLTPPSPYKHIDLYQVVSRKFKLASNKLDYALLQFGLTRKVKHEGFQLWIDCMQGDPKAWDRFRKYNKGDVTSLEELFDHLLAWIPSLPNVALYDNEGEDACPACGGTDLVREGYAFTNLGKFQRFHCSDCGRWSRSGKRVVGADIRGVAS